ncbi:MAG: cyclopropane-fatty-acyl-phospholipid synthase family protein [Hyphomicrobiaceae bacterium]
MSEDAEHRKQPPAPDAALRGGQRVERVRMTGPGSWDERYGGDSYSFGMAPNAYLASQAGLFRPGADVLALADGEGRNGVFLARQGCRVTSVDYSPVGLDKARRLAAQHGVSVETVVADLTRWDWPRETFDAVVAIYFHLPPRLRALVHAKAADALRPGGLVLIEGFRPEQIALQATEDSGGPTDPAMLFTDAMLRADFKGFDVVESQAVETVLDEGPFHTGRAAVLRFVARKPALA